VSHLEGDGVRFCLLPPGNIVRTKKLGLFGF